MMDRERNEAHKARLSRMEELGVYPFHGDTEAVAIAIVALMDRIDALSKSIAPSPWRDMATAPKDGTRIIVCCPDIDAILGRRVMEARFINGAWGDPTFEEWTCQPLAWMPMPAP